MYQLRRMTREDLAMVLEWRNRPETRQAMYTTHPISWEEHQAWFARVESDPTKRYFVATDGSEPVGAVNFVEIHPEQRRASWGFYSGDPARRGVGSQMELAALEYAFKELGLEKLHCEVLASNYGVVRFHRKFGFDLEGRFGAHHWDGQGFQDVFRLAMFRSDWLGEWGDRQRAKLTGQAVEPLPEGWTSRLDRTSEASLRKALAEAVARLDGVVTRQDLRLHEVGGPATLRVDVLAVKGRRWALEVLVTDEGGTTLAQAELDLVRGGAA